MALTMAVERYDRHVPFFTGTVRWPDGLDIRPLEVGEADVKRDGMDRHRRMLQDVEFDIAEMSLSSYLIEKSRNPDLPLTAVPVFPRRYFSYGQIYVRADSGIESPAQLEGRRIGCNGFQVALPVLVRGDLQAEYGVNWKTIAWCTSRPENASIDIPPGVSVERIPAGRTLGRMLLAGELDAVIAAVPPGAARGPDAPLRRLFTDARAEETRYWRKHRHVPILHLVALRGDTVARYPALPCAVMDAWAEAKRQAVESYADANYALFAWARNAAEEQQALMGADPWPDGLAANRAALDRFIRYCLDQGLIGAPFPIDDLFHPSVRDT